MGLYAKLAMAMNSIGTLKKEGENTYFRYKFTTADAAYSAVRDALAEQNIAFVASMVDVQQHNTGQVDKGGSPVVRTIATFEYTFIDPETGEEKACRWVGEATDSQDKGVSKASTSALKHFLLKTFMISTEADDPDKSDGYKGKQEKKAPPTPQQIREAGNRLDEKPAKPANVVNMPQPSEKSQGALDDTPAATRAALSPDKLVNMLKTKATTIDVPVQKDARGIIESIKPEDAKALAMDMEKIMSKETRTWILVQAFNVSSCKDLNPREAGAITAWLAADKVAARKDAEGVKALIERQAAMPATEGK